MRIVIQRVHKSRLEVDNEVVSEIGHGYNVFVGVTRDDTMDNVKRVARRIATVRLFKDENDKLNNDYLRSDGVVCKFAVEQYLKELEDEMFRIRKEN